MQTMLPSWIPKYVGLPFKSCGRDEEGYDCWGLVKLIYERERGVLLPDYLLYDSVSNLDQVEHTVDVIKSEDWVKVERETFLDVILFRCFGRPTHVGLVLDKKRFLHSPEGDRTRVESYDDRVWRRRVDGFYRYEPGH
jgi:cell wall-associated NlpC family hydrolase